MTTIKVNEITQFAGHQSYPPGSVVDDPDTNRAAYLIAMGSVSAHSGAPTNLETPKIVLDGEIVVEAAVDDDLECSPGLWEGLPAENVTSVNLSYQWQSDGVNINGATSNIYTVAVGDADSDITCEVTATNAVNTATSETQTVAIPA